MPGKEVAQVYWSKMDQKDEHPMQVLGGFETSQLAPGEEEVLSIVIPWKELRYMKKSEPKGAGKRGSMHYVWEILQKYGLWKILCKQNRIMFWST